MITGVLTRRLVVIGGSIAITFGTIMTLIYGVIFTTVVPSDILNQATPQPRIAIIIDDDPGVEEFLTYALEGAGFSVRFCLTFCDEPNAEVFLVDAQALRIVVGPGYVKKLRAGHPQAIIIGMTAEVNFVQTGATQTVSEQFLAAGANAVWSKKGTMEQLTALLK